MLLMAFAGLFDIWLSSTGDELRSAAIVATATGAKTRHIHGCMPVIPPDGVWNQWPAPDALKKDLFELLGPVVDDAIDVYPVSARVNRPVNDDDGCIARVAVR